MAELIKKVTRALNDAGNSKRITIKKGWLSILGIEDEDTVETALYYSKKHNGYFFAAFAEDQPAPEEISEDLEVVDE